MGLCLCCCLTSVSACVSGCFGSCINCNSEGTFTRKVKTGYLIAYGSLFLVGFFGFYLPLTFLCAKADGDNWALFKGEGACWNEENGSDSMPVLGVLAGFSIGIGFSCFLCTLIGLTKVIDDVHDGDTVTTADIENPQQTIE